MSTNQSLMTCKELAHALRKQVHYIYKMKSMGFQMPGGTSTLDEARAWLARNPAPYSRLYKSGG